jgi:hypothetical protein
MDGATPTGWENASSIEWQASHRRGEARSKSEALTLAMNALPTEQGNAGPKTPDASTSRIPADKAIAPTQAPPRTKRCLRGVWWGKLMVHASKGGAREYRLIELATLGHPPRLPAREAAQMDFLDFEKIRASADDRTPFLKRQGRCVRTVLWHHPCIREV